MLTELPGLLGGSWRKSYLTNPEEVHCTPNKAIIVTPYPKEKGFITGLIIRAKLIGKGLERKQ